MGLSTLALIVAASAGSLGQFGVFGTKYSVGEVYVLLASLCLASGLQNAAITSSSGSSVRTTHLTGVTTDLGLGLARLCTLNYEDKRIRREYRSNWLRAQTIFSFVLGSVVGAMVCIRFHYMGFYIPAAIGRIRDMAGEQSKTSAARSNWPVGELGETQDRGIRVEVARDLLPTLLMREL